MKNENLKNMERCFHFEFCSKNLCILDNEIDSRVGYAADRCRFMVEPSTKKIANKEFIGGGAVVPDGLMNFVCTMSLKRLNSASKKRMAELARLEATSNLLELENSP